MITFSQLGRYGRLGNQMFQIASTIGIAIKNSYDYAFPEWKNYDAAERFGSKEDIDVQKWFKNRLPLLENSSKERIKADHPIPFGFHGFDIPDNVSLSGHMQSEKYFEHCEETIRHYFEPNAMHIMHNKNDFVAIHLRFGDYSNQRGYHPVQTRAYYEEAISHFPNRDFLVFSDERDKAIELLKGIVPDKNIGFIFEPNTYIAFKYMRACHSFITSNSTFSWWAAWLSKHPDKKIIQPSNWFGPAWNGTMDAKDIYIKNAIVI